MMISLIIFQTLTFLLIGLTLNLFLGINAKEAVYLVSNLSSYVLDYCSRQKISGTHLNQYDVDGIIYLHVVDPKEIFAEKIITILDKNFIFGQRDEARDLFDLYFLLLQGHICKIEDIKNKLPHSRMDVFTMENFSDSLYNTAKPKEWDLMVNQLIIEPKLKELGLSNDDISFENVSKYVVNKIGSLYFK